MTGNPLTNHFRVQNKLTEFYQAALFDLPFAATKLVMLGGDWNGVDAAARRSYDAWLAVANEVANGWYAMPAIPPVTGSEPMNNRPFLRRPEPRLKLSVLTSRRDQPAGRSEAR